MSAWSRDDFYFTGIAPGSLPQSQAAGFLLSLVDVPSRYALSASLATCTVKPAITSPTTPVQSRGVVESSGGKTPSVAQSQRAALMQVLEEANSALQLGDEKRQQRASIASGSVAPSWSLASLVLLGWHRHVRTSEWDVVKVAMASMPPLDGAVAQKALPNFVSSADDVGVVRTLAMWLAGSTRRSVLSPPSQLPASRAQRSDLVSIEGLAEAFTQAVVGHSRQLPYTVSAEGTTTAVGDDVVLKEDEKGSLMGDRSARGGAAEGISTTLRRVVKHTFVDALGEWVTVGPPEDFFSGDRRHFGSSSRPGSAVTVQVDDFIANVNHWSSARGGSSAALSRQSTAVTEGAAPLADILQLALRAALVETPDYPPAATSSPSATLPLALSGSPGTTSISLTGAVLPATFTVVSPSATSRGLQDEGGSGRGHLLVHGGSEGWDGRDASGAVIPSCFLTRGSPPCAARTALFQNVRAFLQHGLDLPFLRWLLTTAFLDHLQQPAASGAAPTAMPSDAVGDGRTRSAPMESADKGGAAATPSSPPMGGGWLLGAPMQSIDQLANGCLAWPGARELLHPSMVIPPDHGAAVTAPETSMRLAASDGTLLHPSQDPRVAADAKSTALRRSFDCNTDATQFCLAAARLRATATIARPFPRCVSAPPGSLEPRGDGLLGPSSRTGTGGGSFTSSSPAWTSGPDFYATNLRRITLCGDLSQMQIQAAARVSQSASASGGDHQPSSLALDWRRAAVSDDGIPQLAVATVTVPPPLPCLLKLVCLSSVEMFYLRLLHGNIAAATWSGTPTFKRQDAFLPAPQNSQPQPLALDDPLRGATVAPAAGGLSVDSPTSASSTSPSALGLVRQITFHPLALNVSVDLERHRRLLSSARRDLDGCLAAVKAHLERIRRSGQARLGHVQDAVEAWQELNLIPQRPDSSKSRNLLSTAPFYARAEMHSLLERLYANVMAMSPPAVTSSAGGDFISSSQMLLKATSSQHSPMESLGDVDSLVVELAALRDELQRVKDRRAELNRRSAMAMSSIPTLQELRRDLQAELSVISEREMAALRERHVDHQEALNALASDLSSRLSYVLKAERSQCEVLREHELPKLHNESSHVIEEWNEKLRQLPLEVAAREKELRRLRQLTIEEEHSLVGRWETSIPVGLLSPAEKGGGATRTGRSDGPSPLHCSALGRPKATLHFHNKPAAVVAASPTPPYRLPVQDMSSLVATPTPSRFLRSPASPAWAASPSPPPRMDLYLPLLVDVLPGGNQAPHETELSCRSPMEEYDVVVFTPLTNADPNLDGWNQTGAGRRGHHSGSFQLVQVLGPELRGFVRRTSHPAASIIPGSAQLSRTSRRTECRADAADRRENSAMSEDVEVQIAGTSFARLHVPL